MFGVNDSLYFPKCPKVVELHSYIFNIVKTASPRESLVWPYRISANVPGPFQQNIPHIDKHSFDSFLVFYFLYFSLQKALQKVIHF